MAHIRYAFNFQAVVNFTNNRKARGKLSDKEEGYRQYIQAHTDHRHQESATQINWKKLSKEEIHAQITPPGIWSCKCSCGEIIVVQPGLPFFCVNCENVQYQYRPRPVKFPTEAQRYKIEAILLKRLPAHRYYLPGETTKQLQKQNEDHGIYSKVR